MNTKEYKMLFPKVTELVSKRFRRKCKKAKEKMRLEFRQYGKKGNAWRYEQDLEAFESVADFGPNIDDLEFLEEIITKLRYNLACGLKGEEYKKACLRLREAKLRYEQLKKQALKDVIRKEEEEKARKEKELMEWQSRL